MRAWVMLTLTLTISSAGCGESSVWRQSGQTDFLSARNLAGHTSDSINCFYFNLLLSDLDTYNLALPNITETLPGLPLMIIIGPFCPEVSMQRLYSLRPRKYNYEGTMEVECTMYISKEKVWKGK